MEEDLEVPIILGRPFLNIVRAIIVVSVTNNNLKTTRNKTLFTVKLTYVASRAKNMKK